MAYDQSAYHPPSRNYMPQQAQTPAPARQYERQGGYGNMDGGYARSTQNNQFQYRADPYSYDDNVNGHGQQAHDNGRRGYGNEQGYGGYDNGYGHERTAHGRGADSDRYQSSHHNPDPYSSMQTPDSRRSNQTSTPTQYGSTQYGDQQYGYHASPDRNQRMNSSQQQYHDRSQQQYNNGYGQPTMHAYDSQDRHNTYDRQHAQPQPQQDERRYDPRYQQRPDRAQPNQATQQRNYTQQNQPYSSQPQQAQQSQQVYNDHNRNYDQYQQPPPPQQQDYQHHHSPSQNKSLPVPPKSAPKKMSMEEWKAQEKAKMHKAADRPETVAQDNAFPSFPTKKDGTRAGGSSALSHRSGEEQTRPSTATSQRPDDTRPSTARGNSYQQNEQGRHSNDQKPALSETSSTRPSFDQKPSYPDSARPSFDNVQRQHQPDRRGSPLNDQRQPQQSRTQTPPQQARPPPQRFDSASTTQSVRASPQTNRALPALNTASQVQDPYQNNARSHQQPTSPLGQYSQSAQSRTISHDTRSPVSSMAAPKPAYAQHNAQNASLSNVYDDYYGETKRPNTSRSDHGLNTRKNLTREEEIEAEMPDFDSAAPSQTNNLHKRNQTMDQHLNSMPPTPSGQPPLPSIPPALNSSTSSTFDFGFSGHQQTNSLDQPLSRPVQPYAKENTERRSMDDGKQLPYRNGQQARPPPQRFYGNSQDNQNQQRPGIDRSATAASAWSDPGLQRVGTAPPPVTRGAQSTVNGYGVPPGQQRSTPGPDPRMMNPDGLPAHPTPIRPGLANGNNTATRPPPVRHYNNDPRAQNHTPAPSMQQQQRVTSVEVEQPVTQAELNRLRSEVEANPASNKTALLYAKKLVEAAKVLANEGGRADSKTTAKNRERYIMDAYKRIKKLVSAGYPEAQFYLADCYGQGMLGLDVDTKEAFKLYQAAAKAGHGTAAYRTAVCCELGPDDGGGTARDYAKAVQWYRRAAALGETGAMFKVGMIALKGLLGQQRNLGEAVTWLKRAAERADKDNSHALYELASLYETSTSTPELRHKVIPDDAYSLQLYRQAAEFGNKRARFRLGQGYEYGNLGLPIDHRASISWYSKAAAQGEHQAELALSGWYLTGAEGILEPSDTEAYLWARKAAQAEPPLAKAMFAMGYFLETGIGCQVNVEEAKRWYGRAASYKHPKALERLEILRRGGKKPAPPMNGKISRKNQQRDEAECTVM